MATPYDSQFRRAGARREAGRPLFGAGFEPSPPPHGNGKRGFSERLLELCGQVSEEVLFAAVIGIITGTPRLRRLFLRILFLTATCLALMLLLLGLFIFSVIGSVFS